MPMKTKNFLFLIILCTGSTTFAAGQGNCSEMMDYFVNSFNFGANRNELSPGVIKQSYSNIQQLSESAKMAEDMVLKWGHTVVEKTSGESSTNLKALENAIASHNATCKEFERTFYSKQWDKGKLTALEESIVQKSVEIKALKEALNRNLSGSEMTINVSHQDLTLTATQISRPMEFALSYEPKKGTKLEKEMSSITKGPNMKDAKIFLNMSQAMHERGLEPKYLQAESFQYSQTAKQQGKKKQPLSSHLTIIYDGKTPKAIKIDERGFSSGLYFVTPNCQIENLYGCEKGNIDDPVMKILCPYAAPRAPETATNSPPLPTSNKAK
jgi:hypothetical protein